jgi:hypothetical protein
MESYLAEGNDNQLSKSEIEELIRGAGRTPVERDTLYNPVDAAASSQPPARRLALPVLEPPSSDAQSPVRG